MTQTKVSGFWSVLCKKVCQTLVYVLFLFIYYYLLLFYYIFIIYLLFIYYLFISIYLFIGIYLLLFTQRPYPNGPSYTILLYSSVQSRHSLEI